VVPRCGRSRPPRAEWSPRRDGSVLPVEILTTQALPPSHACTRSHKMRRDRRERGGLRRTLEQRGACVWSAVSFERRGAGGGKHLHYSRGVTVEEMRQASMALMQLVPTAPVEVQKGRDRGRDERGRGPGFG
jgi:hypothetical protein